MRIETLKKKLNTEFNFSESYESLESNTKFDNGTILLTPHYREKQRPWIQKAYNEWLKGDKTIVLVSPLKPTCKYFKKYLTDVADVRPIKDSLSYTKGRSSDGTYTKGRSSDGTYDNHNTLRGTMIIAIYFKRILGEPNFCVSFN